MRLKRLACFSSDDADPGYFCTITVIVRNTMNNSAAANTIAVTMLSFVKVLKMLNAFRIQINFKVLNLPHFTLFIKKVKWQNISQAFSVIFGKVLYFFG